jgi:hypothetical protein
VPLLRRRVDAKHESRHQIAAAFADLGAGALREQYCPPRRKSSPSRKMTLVAIEIEDQRLDRHE